MAPGEENLSFPLLEESAASCHSCGGRGMTIFYEVRGVPVHSVVLVPNRESALGFPRGDIRLGYCKACGFIENVSFDPSLLDYTDGYEETQSFSPTFNGFAQNLARRLTDRYDIRGKEVMEIGCGKSEFLALLCKLGDNRGIGIDPACVSDRIPDDAARRITFIKESYSEKHQNISADLICCRHTLEHIQQTGSFIRSVRLSAEKRREAIVFIEVPDVSRILRELAFWDVYYEHCSYFSLGSLARLFRSCGFEVLNLSKGYDHQYLLIDARAADGVSGPAFPGEDDLDELARAVEHLALNGAARILEWKSELRSLGEDGRRVVIWGGGSKGVSFLTTLDAREEIQFVVDINPYKQGSYMPGTGQKIISPEFLKEYRPDAVIVMNPIYMGEIEEMLTQIGVKTELSSVLESPRVPR